MTKLVVIYIGMLLLAALLVGLTGCPSLFQLPPDPERLWGSLAAAVLLAAVIVRGGRLLEGVPWYRRMVGVFKRILTAPEALGRPLDSGTALTIAVYSSVGEEALFRGWLQPFLIALLADHLPPVAAAALGLLLAGLVFGLMHFPMVPELVPWTLFALVVGLCFGALALWSGSLLAPVLAHLLINWLNLRRLLELQLDDVPDPFPPR